MLRGLIAVSLLALASPVYAHFDDATASGPTGVYQYVCIRDIRGGMICSVVDTPGPIRPNT